MEGNLGTALLLTTLAGLATGVGGLLALLGRRPGPRFMGLTLGFSAGVMVFVSFVELLPHGAQAAAHPERYLGFLGGMLAFFLVDLAVPHEYIGHHDHPGGGGAGPGGGGGPPGGGGGHPGGEHAGREDRLMRAGLLVALGVGLHNLPEGLATFAGAMQETHVGLAIGGAMALHNIPEGLAVAAPVFAATGRRGKAFGWALLSGLAEPAGAGLAALVLWPFLGGAMLAWFAAAVAGIMVAVAMDELLPAAKAFGSDHAPILGLIAGMAVMALGLWLLHAHAGAHAA